MLVFEFKCKATKQQYQAIDEAIRIGQFIRNKCYRFIFRKEKRTIAIKTPEMFETLIDSIECHNVDELTEAA